MASEIGPRAKGALAGGATVLFLIAAFVLYQVANRPQTDDDVFEMGVIGCYSGAPGASLIQIDASQLTVLQNPRIIVPYKLEHRKKWGIKLDGTLEFTRLAGDEGKIFLTANRGQFLILAPEGLAPGVQGFDLEPVGEGLEGMPVRYSREASVCPPAQR